MAVLDKGRSMIKGKKLSKEKGSQGWNQKQGMLKGALIIYVYFCKLRDEVIQTKFEYDPLGNLVEEQTPDQVKNYSYNAFNQLIQTQVGHLKTQYTYDQNGDLVEKQDQSQTSAYQYDDNRKLVGVNGQILGDQNIKQNPIPVAYDQLGSVIGYVEKDQYNPIHYDAFGEADEKTTQTQYATYPYIPEADMYVAGYRTYDSQNKRFIQEDTYEGTSHNPISQNHYLYCWNNPNKYVDVTGYAPNIVDTFSNYVKYKTYEKIDAFNQEAKEIQGNIGTNVIKPLLNKMESIGALEVNTYVQQVTTPSNGGQVEVAHSVLDFSNSLGFSIDFGVSGNKMNTSISSGTKNFSTGVSLGNDSISAFYGALSNGTMISHFYGFDKIGPFHGLDTSTRDGKIMETVSEKWHIKYGDIFAVSVGLVGLGAIALILITGVGILASGGAVAGAAGSKVLIGAPALLILFFLLKEKLSDKSKAFSLPMCQFFIG